MFFEVVSSLHAVQNEDLKGILRLGKVCMQYLIVLFSTTHSIADVSLMLNKDIRKPSPSKSYDMDRMP